MYLNVDLLLNLADIYDPVDRVIRDIRGEVLLTMSAEEIREVFDTTELCPTLDAIDLNRFLAKTLRPEI